MPLEHWNTSTVSGMRCPVYTSTERRSRTSSQRATVSRPTVIFGADDMGMLYLQNLGFTLSDENFEFFVTHFRYSLFIPISVYD